MTTTAELLAFIGRVIASDAGLSAWCVSKYGKTPTVYVGDNIEDPPIDSDYPVVVIDAPQFAWGNSGPSLRWSFTVWCGVYDEGITEEAIKDGEEVEGEPEPETLATIKTYSGFVDAETFREKVERVLVAARFAKVSFNTESEPVSLYPKFLSISFPTIEQINIRRR
jgi:hypothetical protein